MERIQLIPGDRRACSRCSERTEYQPFPVASPVWRWLWAYCPPCRTELRLLRAVQS